MPQHKAVYFPEKQGDLLAQIEYDIMREDEIAQVNMEIKHLNFRETLFYHMGQMGITEPQLVDACDGAISKRTVQRMLTNDEDGRTVPKRETVVLVCLIMKLPVSLSVSLIGKAGYSFMDGMTGQRLQKLLHHRLNPLEAKRAVNAILTMEKKAA